MPGDAVTLESVIEDVVKERITLKDREEGTVGKTSDKHRKALVDSWQALDRWVFHQLCRRKGVHIPTLCRMTWEFRSSEGGQIRQRPVFALTDAFCRSMRFKGNKPVLPASCSKCEDINFHKLALNFSETITKDVAFLSIRDLVRKLSDKVSQGNTVILRMLAGTLHAKRRTVRFEFDQRAMRPTDAGGPKRSTTLVVEPSVEETERAAEAAPAEVEAETADPAAAAEAAAGEKSDELLQTSSSASPLPEVPTLWGEGQPPTDPDAAKPGTAPFDDGAPPFKTRGGSDPANSYFAAFQRSPSRPIGLEPAGNTILSQYNQLNESMSSGTEDNPALQQAYLRHIAELEREAVFDELEAETILDRQRSMEQQLDEKDSAHRRQLKELQTYIKQQIANRHRERQMEIKERRTPQEEQDQPYMRKLPKEEPLDEDEILDDLGIPIKQLRPMDLKDPKVRLALLRKRGKAKAVRSTLGKKQLLTSLQRQMEVKAHKEQRRKDAELEEEKRYLDHLLTEMDMHSRQVRAEKLSTERDLLAAWERDGHLKNLKKLKTIGAGPVREYAATALLASSRGGSSTLTSAPSSMSKMGVGFDPRASARSS